MNKNILLITVTLALSLSWVGCNKSGKLDKVSTFKTPSGPVELKLKWPVGERVVQRFDMKQNMEIFVPNQPNSIKQDMTMGQEYGLTVLKETPEGGHEVELEFLGMQMVFSQGGKSVMNYDSAKKSSPDNANPMADAFQKIIGAKIQYFLDVSNNVERIEGVDALVSRLESGGSPEATAPLKSMFNEGYFKQIIGGSRSMPPKPVQPGDTWPVQLEIAMGPIGTLVMDYNFTFQKWEQRGKRNCARLEFRGTITSKPDDSSRQPGMTMDIQDGTSSGVSWFDPELGKIIETSLKQNITMAMTIPINMNGKTFTQAMTNIMNQVITIKLDSVK
jgi:Family of unknown function (DUF6263)